MRARNQPIARASLGGRSQYGCKGRQGRRRPRLSGRATRQRQSSQSFVCCGKAWRDTRRLRQNLCHYLEQTHPTRTLPAAATGAAGVSVFLLTRLGAAAVFLLIVLLPVEVFDIFKRTTLYKVCHTRQILSNKSTLGLNSLRNPLFFIEMLRI